MHTLLLEMKRPQTQTPAPPPAQWVRRKCAHNSGLGQHHYCVRVLSGVELIYFFLFSFFFLYYTLEALILSCTVGTPSYLHQQPPPLLMMRRLRQKELENSAAHEHTCTRRRNARYEIPLTLKHIPTAGAAAIIHVHCLHYAVFCQIVGKSSILSL